MYLLAGGLPSSSATTSVLGVCTVTHARRIAVEVGCRWLGGPAAAGSLAEEGSFAEQCILEEGSLAEEGMLRHYTVEVQPYS